MIHPDVERVALLGWRLYPCSRVSKAGCIKRGTDLATCDLDQLDRWSREFPNCNWRVVMHGSGIFALDLDVPPGHAHDGIANMAALVKANTPLPERPTARSGGGGLIMVFNHTTEKIIGEGGRPAPGIDPRRGRQSQTVPPSIHTATGRPYRWLVAPWEVNPPKAPSWLLRALAPPPEPAWTRPVETSDAARNRLYRSSIRVINALPGQRNAALNRSAYYVGTLIRDGLLGPQEAAESLYGAARAAGLEDREITATIKSGLSSGARHG